MTEDRNARLKALANRAGRTKEPAPDNNDGESTDPPPTKPNLSFRNYAPTDSSLAREGESKSASKSTGPSASKRPRTAESQGSSEPATTAAPVSSSDALKNALYEARTEATTALAPTQSSAQSQQETTVANLAPKKSNWDLKRDIADKLARLERRTQKAIVEILKERLESEAANAIDEEGGGGSDLD
eukprot:jgi/Psemu1/235230/estExt_Genewise1.C_260126